MRPLEGDLEKKRPGLAVLAQEAHGGFADPGGGVQAFGKA
jgi:hypothetical protein